MKGATERAAKPYPPCAVSIHAPNEGSDLEISAVKIAANVFQSTLPMKGATELFIGGVRQRHVSIHAPNEGSDCQLCLGVLLVVVSIHAPNEGSDSNI